MSGQLATRLLEQGTVHSDPPAFRLALPPLPPPADATYRAPNSLHLGKRFAPGAAFRFAVPGPQVRAAWRLPVRGSQLLPYRQALALQNSSTALGRFLDPLNPTLLLLPPPPAPQFLDDSFLGPGGEPVRQGECPASPPAAAAAFRPCRLPPGCTARAWRPPHQQHPPPAIPPRVPQRWRRRGRRRWAACRRWVGSWWRISISRPLLRPRCCCMGRLLWRSAMQVGRGLCAGLRA